MKKKDESQTSTGARGWRALLGRARRPGGPTSNLKVESKNLSEEVRHQTIMGFELELS
jgi:hypothetical protein